MDDSSVPLTQSKPSEHATQSNAESTNPPADRPIVAFGSSRDDSDTTGGRTTLWNPRGHWHCDWSVAFTTPFAILAFVCGQMLHWPSLVSGLNDEGPQGVHGDEDDTAALFGDVCIDAYPSYPGAHTQDDSILSSRVTDPVCETTGTAMVLLTSTVYAGHTH